MASTKVVIAQADYKHLLAAVKLLAGNVNDTEKTVDYVFSQLEELGIEVEDAKEDQELLFTGEDLLKLGRIIKGPAVWESKQIWPAPEHLASITPPHADEDIDKYRLALRAELADLFTAIRENQFEPFKFNDVPEMKNKSGIGNRCADRIVDKPADATFPADFFKDLVGVGVGYASVLRDALPEVYSPAGTLITNIGSAYQPETTTFNLEPEIDPNNLINVCSNMLASLCALTDNISLLSPTTPKEIEGSGNILINDLMTLNKHLTIKGIQDTSTTPEEQSQYGVIKFGDEGFTKLKATDANGNMVAENPLAIALETYDAVFEDPLVDLDTVLLVVDTHPKVNRLVFHPETPYKLVNAVKTKVKIECVVNSHKVVDSRLTIAQRKPVISTEEIEERPRFSIDNGMLTFHTPDIHISDFEKIGESIFYGVTFHPETSPALASLVEHLLQDKKATDRLDELAKTSKYQFSTDNKVLFVHTNNKDDLILLLSNFKRLIKKCLISREMSTEDISDLQLRFAEVKISCLNGIK